MTAMRYIFKFGAPSSSPGYQETPIIFWMIKYVLVAGVFGTILTGLNKFRLWEWGGFAVLAISAALGAYQSDSRLIQIAALYVIIYGLLFVLARSSWFLARIEQVKNMTKALWVLTVAGVVFLLMQIGLYFTMGILPSHSHPNSLIIRFGSFLDDSLAFGILLPMFAGLCFYVIANEAGKIIVLLVTCMIAVLTGSFTAMATTALFSVWLLRQNRLLAASWLGVIALIILTFRFQFHELWQQKSGSISAHLDGFNGLSFSVNGLSSSVNSLSSSVNGLSSSVNSLSSSAASDKGGGFAESGYVLVYNNFGLIALVIILVVHGITFFACRRQLVRQTSAGLNPFVGAVDGLNFSAAVASLNLPVIMIFPVYLLLALFAAIVIGLADTATTTGKT